MSKSEVPAKLTSRAAPIEMTTTEFRAAGHRLVDRIAEFLETLPNRPLTPSEPPHEVRAALGEGSLPDNGSPAAQILDQAASLLFEHSLLSAHPRFWGYIYSSAAPIGALGDFLAAAVNPNVGAWNLSPIASEIEAQTVRWIAELIGYPRDCGGLLVSGGNMANFVPFLAARAAQADWDIRAQGLQAGRPPRVYCSTETHTWIHKATDLFGFGTEAIRWIPTDDQLRMDTAALRTMIREDKERGDWPFIVVGAAGSVSTGAVDPLPDIAAICRENNLWFHVDGAYGAIAACLPEASADLRGLALADSVAVDPHKWLYAPLEAGCVLVRERKHLPQAFSHRPPYYHFPEHEGEESFNYYEYGLQNSRGFRALKVWLALRQVGRAGYSRMVADDVRLSQALFAIAQGHPELEASTQSLSITTFRFVPRGLKPGEQRVEEYLNKLNHELLTRLQRSGETFLTNAVIRGKFVLRACFVNFHSTLADVEALPEIVTRIGVEVDRELRSSAGL